RAALVRRHAVRCVLWLPVVLAVGRVPRKELAGARRVAGDDPGVWQHGDGRLCAARAAPPAEGRAGRGAAAASSMKKDIPSPRGAGRGQGEGRSFWERRVRDPILAQLRQGITPEKIAL